LAAAGFLAGYCVVTVSTTNPYVSLLNTAWRYARRQRRRFVLIYTMFVGANLVAAANPILYGWFIDRIQRRGAATTFHDAAVYASLFFALKLLEWCFHGPARILERQLSFNLSRNFLQERYHQVLHLPAKWHQDHHSGATINRVRKAYEALRAFFDGGFMYIHALSKFVFSFLAMVYFSPLFGAIGVALGFLTIWVIFRFDKPVIRTQEEINEREHTLSATVFDTLSNIMTVITLRLEKRMEGSLANRVAELWPALRANALVNEWKWFFADTLVTVTYCVITVGYVYQNWEAGKTFYVGGLVTLLGYVNQFTSVFHDMAWQYNQIVQYNTDVETARDIPAAYEAQHRADSLEELPPGWQTIRIERLNFSHREAASLLDITLELRRGRRVALIGESGCGKSTLLALLRGLYVPQAGVQIRVDGVCHEFAALNANTTLFPQEPEIFENTLRYNITLGLPLPEDEVNAVCQGAHFQAVAAALPKGLESNIQEKGVNLSGGQKQRLALARGLLAARDSAVVLLDEPTSSVDSKTEAHIYENLFREFSGKAMVSALHRLHLLRYFDYVYVLRDGRIVDEGTFEQLRARSAIFGELWRHQEDGAISSAS
jgi:ABC-type multidrug transport system fused ATPase/permease subunit